MKWLLFKIIFFYPKIYSFFQYHRNKEWRKEFEDKISFCYQLKNSSEIKKIVKSISELRGIRKIMKRVIPHMDKKFVEQFVSIEGIQYLDQALEDGKGVLLMAAHIGVPHLAFNALRAMGYDVTLLSGVTPKQPRRFKNKYYDTEDKTIFVHDQSQAKIYKKRIIDTLSSGGIIYYDADAGEGRAGEEIFFLGAKMKFPTGMVHYAHQAGAAVIPFMHLQEQSKTSLMFQEPANNNWKHGEMEYRSIMQKYVQMLEQYIIKYPGQYLGIYGPTVLSYFYRDNH